MQPGDKVRVHVDTNGGWHGYVGTRGYYMDTVRKVFEQTMTDGTKVPAVVLTRVSWAPAAHCEPTESDDAQVAVGGKTFRVRMLNRGNVWWAKLPGGLEPLACEERYEQALQRAVEYLGRRYA